jgi:crotonobetainyl-CoA:carnitine CoA-transferase CaiB-like acyl-CoA transferase
MDKYPPLYGEHTDEVLQQSGYSKEQIFDFKQNKIIYRNKKNIAK